MAPKIDVVKYVKPNYYVVLGIKISCNPDAFDDTMATLHLVFRMRPRQAIDWDDEFLRQKVATIGFRIDVHRAFIETEKYCKTTDYAIQYDLEMSSSNVGTFLNKSSDIMAHAHFNSLWKHGEAGKDILKPKCHYTPVEPHGCTCSKHVKAFQEKLILLRCRKCSPTAKPRMKKERA